MSYTTASRIGEVVGPMVERIYRNLARKYTEGRVPMVISESIGEEYKRRIIEEQQKCKKCRGLEECQYTSIGNTGFRPIWEQWSPIYSYVSECEYKRQQSTQAKIDRLFGVSQIPERYKGVRIRESARLTGIIPELLGVVTGEIRELIIIGGSGSDRTEAVSGICNELIVQGVEVMYTTAAEIGTHLRFNNPDYYKKMEILTGIPMLVIEEMRSEQSEYNREQLDVVIERRRRGNKRTVLTGERAELSKLKEPLRERLKEVQLAVI